MSSSRFADATTPIRANPPKGGDAKVRVLASSATPTDATKDPKTAGLPKGC
jgi:hypothetical protein